MELTKWAFDNHDTSYERIEKLKDLAKLVIMCFENDIPPEKAREIMREFMDASR